MDLPDVSHYQQGLIFRLQMAVLKFTGSFSLKPWFEKIGVEKVVTDAKEPTTLQDLLIASQEGRGSHR